MASAAGSRIRAEPGTYMVSEDVAQNAQKNTLHAAEDDDDFDEQEGAEEEEDGEEEGEDDDASTASGPLGEFPFLEKSKLPAYHSIKRTLSHLKLLLQSEYMDLNPHYQRNVVWRRRNMIKLIDSLWKRYYIPPVIFNVNTVIFEGDDTPRYVRTCIDGKQRLTSILKFMEGEFPIKIDGKAWWFKDTRTGGKGRGKNVLPEKAKQEFEALEILCMEYKGLRQSKEIELFQRVQEGKPLTAAESLKATVGPWQDFARLFEEDYADVMGLARQNDRASSFRMVLSCFSQIFECQSPSASNGRPILKTSAKNVEQLARMPLDERSKERCRFVFDLFAAINDLEPSIFTAEAVTRVQSFSPLELVAVCCMLSKWGKQRPKGTLTGDINLLRKKLREAHSDLRLNGMCWKTAWSYIDNLEDHRGIIEESNRQGAGPGSGKLKKKASKKSGPLAPAPASGLLPAGPPAGTFRANSRVTDPLQTTHQTLANEVGRNNYQPVFIPVNNDTVPQQQQQMPGLFPPGQGQTQSTTASATSAPTFGQGFQNPGASPFGAKSHQPPQSPSANDEDAQRQRILAQFQGVKAHNNKPTFSTFNGAHSQAPVYAGGQQPAPAPSLNPTTKRNAQVIDLDPDMRTSTRVKQEVS